MAVFVFNTTLSINTNIAYLKRQKLYILTIFPATHIFSVIDQTIIIRETTLFYYYQINGIHHNLTIYKSNS